MERLRIGGDLHSLYSVIQTELAPHGTAQDHQSLSAHERK